MVAWILKHPKLLGAGITILVIGAFAVHYRLLVGERDELRITKVELEGQLAAQKARADRYKAAEQAANVAAATAIAQRAEAQAALDRLRAGRTNDPEAQTWAAQPVPQGERARLCEALPTLKGCIRE